MVAGDLVESGSDHVRPGRRRLVIALVVVLAVVAATAWFLDSRRRTHEFSAMLHCVTAAEDAWGDADAHVTAMTRYVRPSIGSDPSRTVDLGLYRLVAGQAAADEPAVRHALQRCRTVSLLPFHRALRAALSAYLAWLQAEVDRLAATATDGSRAFAGSDQLTRLRNQAFTRLLLVAPDDRSRDAAQRFRDRR